MRKIKLQKIVGNLLDKLRKLFHKGNGYLEMFSLPQGIENSRQFFAPSNRKKSLGASWYVVTIGEQGLSYCHSV